MTLAAPLAFPPSSAPAQPGNSGGLFNSDAQTAVINKWVFPPITEFSFDFVAEPLPPLHWQVLPLPAVNDGGNRTIDLSMFMIPYPAASSTMEQANLAGGGFALSPEFYHPGWGGDSSNSSRESSMSPDTGMFDGMPQWLPFSNDPLLSGYYGL